MADSDTRDTPDPYREAVGHLLEGEPDRAVSLLEPLVSADPRFEPTLALGKAYLELGRSDDAARCFERLLAEAAVDSGVRPYVKLLAATAHILSGGRHDAFQEIEEAVRMDSRLVPAAEALRRGVEGGSTASL